ncbi:MAG: hypothetical protein CMF22_10655 [Idiomarinaceae bacterium]|nr:hypothetical protein [Idiomarinaceae bacterium]MBG23901.1 hypothetical protein [Idiomarinaceae bacterium]
MDISDAEETFIIRGIQLVPLFDLLGQYSLVSPEGTFILLPIEEASFSNSSIPNPRRLDLTHQLIYLDSEGLETIQGV